MAFAEVEPRASIAGPVSPVGEGADPLRWLALLLFGTLSALGFVLLQAGAIDESTTPASCAAAAFVLLLLHVLISLRTLKPADPLLWIPVVFFLFYFGMPPAVEFVALPGSTGYWGWTDIQQTRSLGRGFAMALLSFCSFLAGIHLCGIARLPNRLLPPQRAETSLRPAGLTLVLGAGAMIAVGILIAGPGVVFGPYSALVEHKRHGLDTRFMEIGLMFMQGGVIATLACHDRRAPLPSYLAIVAAAASGFLMLQIGDRGGLFAFSIAGAWVFTQRVWVIRWPVPLAGAIAALLLIPAMKEFREYDSTEETSKQGFVQRMASSSYEMGTTVLCFGYTLDLIPSEKSYAYGLSVVDAVVNAVPNFGLTPGKSFVLDPMKSSPPNWLTVTLNPIKYEYGGGYGYALGAEWYFNFGTPGVWLGMVMMGYLTTRLRNRAHLGQMSMAIACLYFAMLVLLVRNALGYPLKLVLWPVIGLLILRWISGLFSPPGTSPDPAPQPSPADPSAASWPG